MSCVLSKCNDCKYFHNDKNIHTCNCDAFPDLIPIEKWKANEDVPCTEKYRFTPIETKDK